MTYSTDMNQIYMTQADQYSASPLAFSQVPDLISCAYDDETDPSPSPPVTYSNQFGSFDYGTQVQPQIINSVEFHDLTQLQADDRAQWQHSHQSQRSSPQRQRTAASTNPSRSSTQDNKDAATNMRIRRRAQNRASQRAFRERKEKHVQHLEHELEELESKHQHLTKSYSELDSRHADAQSELAQLRNELAALRASSREGSISSGSGPATIKRENPNYFDPFATDAYFGSGSGSDLGF